MPEGTLVINASPIIFLDQVGGLGWLKHLAEAAMRSAPPSHSTVK